MWLSKILNENKTESPAVEGISTGNSADGTCASAEYSAFGIPAFSPYGYTAAIPAGEELLLINSAAGTVCAGCREGGAAGNTNSNNAAANDTAAAGLAPGEISITSLGGASITLKNDGSVIINGLTITKDGVLLNS